MGLSANQALPWLIDVDVFEQAVSHVNWNTLAVGDASDLFNCRKHSSGAQNDEISFSIVLAKGTWDLELLHLKSSIDGIASVQLDGVEVGTIDGYSAATIYNVLSSVTGIAVATTAKYTLKLKMATKNASSGNYLGRLQHIQLRRTA